MIESTFEKRTGAKGRNRPEERFVRLGGKRESDTMEATRRSGYLDVSEME